MTSVAWGLLLAMSLILVGGTAAFVAVSREKATALQAALHDLEWAEWNLKNALKAEREMRAARDAVIATPAPTWLEALTLHRVIAHTTDDQSIEGLLDHVGPDGITLRTAKLLGSTPTELAGETWIPRSKVRFVQTVPNPTP